ncbi:MAG: hypothetical protein IPK65_01215 [Gammaproteobacteria bacterium]|nr:hypothetical protein [Gammaproteobacteria bacterium]
MITIEHPSIRKSVADLGYGLLPVFFRETEKYALIVKAPKEAILTARINQEMSLYLVPDGSRRSHSLGIITAFYDDHDEPLVLFTPMYSGNQLQIDIGRVLNQDAFEVFFFDENHREMMGVRVRVNDSAKVRAKLEQQDFNDLVLDQVGNDLEAMRAWFGMRSTSDDDAAFVLRFEDRLYPDDLVFIDANPNAYDFHGAEGSPAYTSLERREPGGFQERDIVGLLKRSFPASSIYLNPIRLDSGKEYADILCLTDEIMLVVQGKDSPNTEASLRRSIERKRSVIRAHIGKASQQLRGALSFAKGLGPNALKVGTSDSEHSLNIHGRLTCGLVVVRELLDDDYRACSTPVLNISIECELPCVLTDYSALHMMTMHLTSPARLMSGFLQLFDVGVENGEFPKPRFLGPPAG